MFIQRVPTALEKVESERKQKLKEFNDDPYIGFDSFDDAIDSTKFSSQAEVLSRLFKRQNVFVSGMAGSGKTYIVQRFIDHINAEFDGNFDISVTATTGIAATNFSDVGGSTLHSWACWNFKEKIPEFTPEELFKNVHGRQEKIEKMKYTDVLIIDEISMLPAWLFEKLDQQLKYIRGNDEPFGGLQLILMGDFMQLPPIRTRETPDELNTDFCINTATWDESNIHCMFMDKVKRGDDKRLKNILASIVSNKINDTMKNLLYSRIGTYDDRLPDKAYTTLFTTNRNVDKFNQKELDKNPNPLVQFAAVEEGELNYCNLIYRNNNIPKVIDLKLDAIVMITKNIFSSSGVISNGSIGKVFRFNYEDNSVFVRLNDGNIARIYQTRYEHTIKKSYLDSNKKKVFYDNVVASVLQFPLKLGYAITVHKSQGQTFSGVLCDLSNCFTPGLGYVALSRVRSLEDLIILNINNKAFDINGRSYESSREVRKSSLKEKEELIKNKDDYEKMLVSEKARALYWDPNNGGSQKIRKDYEW